ncbi:MAG: class I SAM-dependent methyltransferase [Nitrososphaerota archaeon]|nr:class I SAM-dependent methyltransferase [Nitrososphaerota archaeon]
MDYEEKVKEFYGGFVQGEWKRLVSDRYHRLEYDTTLRYLEKYLPGKGRVLDAGGGPGRYAMELARRGYDVALLDITPANLRFARERAPRARMEFLQGSVVDLSRFADRSFDAVLCLGGVLSHVVDPTDRERAVRELVRVAKDGAPIFVFVINRTAVLLTFLLKDQDHIELPVFERYLNTGDYYGEFAFTAHHGFLPEELRGHFEGRRDVKVLETVGLEGLSSSHPKETIRLARNGPRWRIWLEAHYKTCTHPSVVGASEHILAICRKTDPASGKS